jgi:CHASE2 domain-containing sensor protein
MANRWSTAWRWLRGEGLAQLFVWAFSLALLFTLLGSEDLGRRLNKFFNDRPIYDVYARLAPVASQVSQQILIIDLGQAGGLTDRQLLAQAVARCLAAGAAAVGVDILILGPSPGDDELLGVLRQDPSRVILASDLKVPTLFAPYVQVPGIRTGFTNFMEDRQDQTIRVVQLWDGPKRDREAFSTLLLATAGLNHHLEDVPTDAQGRLRLWFPRAPHLLFPVIKVQKLLAAPPEALNFAGHILLVGNVTGKLSATDLCLTPVGPLPGLLVHAIVMENLLNRTFPRTLAELLAPKVGGVGLANFLLLTGLLFFLALLFRGRSRTFTYALMAALFVAIFVAGYIAYSRWYLMLPITALYAGVLVWGLMHLRSLRVAQAQALDRLQEQYQDDMSRLSERLITLQDEQADLVSRLQELGLLEPLRHLEQTLRRLCAQVFRGKYGEDWEATVLDQLRALGAQEHPRPYTPKKLKFWIKERDRLRAEFPAEPITFLNGTQLSDFKSIFEDFPQDFAFLFPGPKALELFQRDLDDIREVRNLVAHHNPVPEGLKKRVLGNCQDIHELIVNAQVPGAARLQNGMSPRR